MGMKVEVVQNLSAEGELKTLFVVSGAGHSAGE